MTTVAGNSLDRFSGSLEGLTEPREAAILVVSVYYTYKYSIKEAEENGAQGRVWESPAMRFGITHSRIASFPSSDVC